MIPTNLLCSVIVYVKVFMLTKNPVLTDRANFYTETAWGGVSLG